MQKSRFRPRNFTFAVVTGGGASRPNSRYVASSVFASVRATGTGTCLVGTSKPAASQTAPTNSNRVTSRPSVRLYALPSAPGAVRAAATASATLPAWTLFSNCSPSPRNANLPARMRLRSRGSTVRSRSP